MFTIPMQVLRRLFLRGNRGAIVMLGSCFLDDSADANQSQAFVAAGFYCIDSEWKRLRREWRKVLKPHNIRYYRTTDWRNLTGEFAKLIDKWGVDKARTIADRIRTQLTRILDGNEYIVGLGMGVNLPDFYEVDAMPEAKDCPQWMRENHDYKAFAFRAVFYRMTQVLKEELPGENYVTFICDESSHTPKIRRALKRMKEKYPGLGQHILGFAEMDDKRIPELQMADFMADLARECVTRFIANGAKDIAVPKALETKIFTIDCHSKHSMLRVLSGEAKGV